MKKTVLVFLLIFVTFGAFAQNGVIRELSGTVELKMPGASSYAAAKIGDRVSQNTVISTSFRSSALIAVGSTLLTVRPLTRLTLTEIRSSSGTETLNVNLIAGRMRVDVNPPAGSRAVMSVKSPIATASVRGTSFEFDTRNLSVNQGTVSFQGNQGKLMLVNAGSSSQIYENGRAADPVVIRTADLTPPSPVGTDAALGSPDGGSLNSGGMIGITLGYE